ncbi:DUF1176 domain-containing protein [Leminorella grimontii]|uniref:DUF1176 domain-containing protein n=1 Tax=Leminorella grimontii TaxID=82981 RepID=UPI00321F8CC5
MRTLLALTLTLLFTPFLFAAQPEGMSFSHKDWEMTCDNTRTCRAAGYGVEEGEVSVLLTREAGAGKEVSAVVTFGTFDEQPVSAESVTMVIYNKPKFTLTPGKEGEWLLTPKQVPELIEALIQSYRIVFYQGSKARELSSSGVNAVLLKMDEYQGRLGTVGALIKKGNKDESGVLSAVTPPKIVAAPVYIESEEKPFPQDRLAALWPTLSKTLLDEDSCFSSNKDEASSKENLRIIVLDKEHSLIKGACWMAAYNYGNAYWLVDSELKTTPTLINTDITFYGNGVLMSSQKGRGVGDCWSHDEWVWDGEKFQKSQSYDTGACRAISAGGTWQLYSWVTDVVKP